MLKELAARIFLLFLIMGAASKVADDGGKSGVIKGRSAADAKDVSSPGRPAN